MIKSLKMNLYNKIYKAINEGIQKALLIDPDQNDVSINYSYHKINNAIFKKEDFNNIAEKFIENPNKLLYDKVIMFSMYGVYQYKLNDIFKLNYIISKIYREFDEKPDFSWLDTDMLTFILEDNTELRLFELTNDNLKNIQYVKFIFNDNNMNYSFIISTDYNLTKNTLIFSEDLIERFDDYEDEFDNTLSKNKYIEDKNKAIQDFDGYANTYKYNNIGYDVNSDDYLFAAYEYLKEISTDTYQAYMPALGEMILIDRYKRVIENIINCLILHKYDISWFDRKYNWWTSTSKDTHDTWTIIGDDDYIGIGPITEYDKGGDYAYNWYADENRYNQLQKQKTLRKIYLFPLFKKIN